MPRQTKIESSIPAIYKKSALSQLLFGYVKGARAVLHTLTIKDAVAMFMEDFGLTHDDFNCDSAVYTFDTMQKELIALLRTDNKIK